MSTPITTTNVTPEAYNVFATSKPMKFMERSVILTPVSALINIVRAAFNALASTFAKAEDKAALRDKAFKQLTHGLKTFLPVIGFVMVVYPQIKAERAEAAKAAKEAAELEEATLAAEAAKAANIAKGKDANGAKEANLTAQNTSKIAAAEANSIKKERELNLKKVQEESDSFKKTTTTKSVEPSLIDKTKAKLSQVFSKPVTATTTPAETVNVK